MGAPETNVKKKTTIRANEMGLVNLTELSSRLGHHVEKIIKTLLKRNLIKEYFIENCKRRFFNLPEVEVVFKDYTVSKNRTFRFKPTCNRCGNMFEYEKTIFCTGRTEIYILENPNYRLNRRVWCGACRLPPPPPLKEKVRQQMKIFMENWWENISPQKRTAMRIKSSKKKKEWWSKQSG